MTQHTPGPWEIIGTDRIYNGEIIAPPETRHGSRNPVAIACDFNRYDRDEERKANAALIAAAPELLEAADNFLNFFERVSLIEVTSDLGESLVALREAVAKAKGGAA